MTKQDAIKNAYGEYWEQVKEWVDKDGWVNPKSKIDPFTLGGFKLVYDTETSQHSKFYDEERGNILVTWRMKSLQGIESNNGWIKLEKQDDLPLKDIEYFAINDDGEIYIYSIEELLDYLPYITHYQPIIKPSKPIY